MNFGEQHHDDGEAPPISTSVRPAQLPADDADFVGRDEEIASIVSSFGARDSVGGAVAFVGAPGVGKTALAVHLAHRLKAFYSDAQLYVNLSDSGDEADYIEQILERILRAFGIPGSQLADSLEEKVGQYRSHLASRRCLLVLDNVSAEDHVRTLLPGSSGSITLITSRCNLAGLAGGTRRVQLNTLSQGDSIRVLERIVGDERVRADLEQAREIVDLCGGLPLALRITANRIKDRSNWALSYHASRLQNRRKVLQSLQSGDLAVRASFSLSYDSLSATEKMVFRYFGVTPKPGTSAALIAHLCELDEFEAEDVLNRLCDFNLLQPAAASGRYLAHDLIRLFCQERLREEDGDQAEQVLISNSVTWYAAMCRSASGALYAGEGPSESYFIGPQAATDWLEEELPALVDSVVTAYEERLDDHLAIAMSSALMIFFERRHHVKSWLQVTSYAVMAARRARCNSCLVDALLDSIRANAIASREQVSLLEYLSEAYQLAQDLGSPKKEARVLYRLGLEAKKRDHPLEAEKVISRALELAKAAGDSHQQGRCLISMGDICMGDGRNDMADECYRLARACFLSRRDKHCQGLALLRMARLQLSLKSYQDAGQSVRMAVKLFDAVHDVHCLGIAQSDGADIAVEDENLPEADDLYTAACRCFEKVADFDCWAFTLRRYAKLDSLQGKTGEAAMKIARAAELEKQAISSSHSPSR